MYIIYKHIYTNVYMKICIYKHLDLRANRVLVKLCEASAHSCYIKMRETDKKVVVLSYICLHDLIVWATLDRRRNMKK